MFTHSRCPSVVFWGKIYVVLAVLNSPLIFLNLSIPILLCLNSYDMSGYFHLAVRTSLSKEQLVYFRGGHSEPVT